MLIDGDFALCDSIGDLRLSRRGLSRRARCSRATRRTAPAPAGSRNMPTPGSATCSSGACSTRRSSIRWCGASRATRSGSRKTLAEDTPAALDYLESAAARRRLPVRRDRPGRHLDRQLLPQRALMPASRSIAARWPRIARLRRRGARPSGVRQAAAVRGRPAQRRHQGPAPGAARCRRAADRARRLGTREPRRGHDAALARSAAGGRRSNARAGSSATAATG